MLLASRLVAEDGFWITAGTTEDAAEVNVVTRKTWTTWKAKYIFCTLSSTLEREGSPAILAITNFISKPDYWKGSGFLTSQDNGKKSHENSKHDRW